ncbi:MAG: enoyl-CoA hydratase/isomerase family protein [Dehalococcoidia bacterium]|nr:MAG: enoyl-CoA hydratase [bacterium]MCE7928969.1 enoyl-CoA hydratase [Chloroflexi bacterium CFX7]MCK6563251.1 enoyl-CoA hydratase-related protein [Dehalococcoidia bacterium]MCL4232794.1 enoyl-CoA hydratase/isomerase family protein [Dehalococcoidia bacterium]NUQ56795.1 enoyl-CoA hydratase/isomerase family protein [Dehalococcoidia bacterium]
MAFCRYEKKGRVAYLTITRPEVMNSLHAPANAEMNDYWDDFAADDGLWVAVLTGEGDRAFSAGNDLKYTAEVSRLPADQRPSLRPPSGGFGGLTSRFDLFKPVIARVNGFALGGGLEMALACDIIVAAGHAELGLPEPRRGLIAGAMGVHRLPRQLPLKVAMGHMLTGRHLTAQRAYEAGLVNDVAPLADLDSIVDGYVQDILRCAPLSVRATKEAAYQALALPLAEAGRARFEWETRRRTSEDAIEGPRAFAEKRAPNWTGR